MGVDIGRCKFVCGSVIFMEAIMDLNLETRYVHNLQIHVLCFVLFVCSWAYGWIHKLGLGDWLWALALAFVGLGSWISLLLPLFALLHSALQAPSTPYVAPTRTPSNPLTLLGGSFFAAFVGVFKGFVTIVTKSSSRSK